MHQRVGIYGARGEMAEAVFEEVRRHADVDPSPSSTVQWRTGNCQGACAERF